jgi:CBS domain-containing protein
MYDDVLRRFLTLVIPNLLTEEFPPQYIFSVHPAWQNGPWEARDSHPRSAVAVSFRGRLLEAIEIETPRSLACRLTPQRWKRFPSGAYLGLVVPKRLVGQSAAMASEVGVAVHDLWSYVVDPAKSVRITKESSDATKLSKDAESWRESSSRRRPEEMRACNVMTPDPVTVREDTLLSDAARLLVDNWVSGLPVVGAEGEVVGIISERDLLFRHESIRCVRDVMTRKVITADESASIEELAAILLEQCIKRVPIVQDGRLVGIASRHDLLLAQLADETATSEEACRESVR